MAEPLSELIEEVVSAPLHDDSASVAQIMISEDTTSIGLLLESLPVNQRVDAWQLVPDHKKVQVLVEMRSDPREVLIATTEPERWDALFTGIDAETLLELADSLPDSLVDKALAAMDKQQHEYFKDASQYAEEQIGHWLTHDVLTLPINADTKDAMRLIRRTVPRLTDCIFLVNRAGQFSAAVRLTRVFGAPEHLKLVELAEPFIDVVKAEDVGVVAAKTVQRSGFTAIPVLDENNILLGRVDIASACELIDEYHERQVMASAGMDENEDLFSPVRKSAQGRAIWLGINLVTAFLASWFIGLFEATLQQVVALAVLMPVVASMGGIAGSQTLTLIVRGLALGQVTDANRKALLNKELRVGALNGVIWAGVIGFVAFIWFSNAMLGLVIGLAILLNIIAAALSGVFLPVVLSKLKLDPALSGSVILTTVTDIVGFVTFLGLGTVFLL
ncbi:magnesium transporter [Alteromonas sediminis]|uniref:Magnesium transporter n=1 Tax=Alteromonas sediminis TaxID=2259342 RepID=A0A3N5YNS8_9ALTE|nr:magnesium transporter [Alteromonas sediminis]RPJ67361.1 magnesium transporter [Alteromonas sediminis]